MWKQVIIFPILFVFVQKSFAQLCTNAGQTPESAILVCGEQTYSQSSISFCGNLTIPVPCMDAGSYQNKNPIWYKFSCYVTGTIGFIITPHDPADDFNWQLFDATGHNPSDVFNQPIMFVSCNWSGDGGETGSSSAGSNTIVCSGANQPTFSAMATIFSGHEYLLMVSNNSGSANGYNLVFSEGNASITDPVLPAISNVRTSCDGSKLIVKTNRKVRCSSIAPDGSDFTIGNAANIISASSLACGQSFQTDSILLTLDASLPFGNYTLTMRNGSDGNTLIDYCNKPVNEGNNFLFPVTPLAPTPLDSIAPFPCASTKLNLIFKRPIRCSSIAGNGSDFAITGPQSVGVTGVNTTCMNNTVTYSIELKLSSSLSVGGNYQVQLQPGSDGNTIIDECGNQTPASAFSFFVSPKASADFDYTLFAGCRNDTLKFNHNGSNGVNSWNWTFDNSATSNQQAPVQIYSATSQHVVKLVVSNGSCRDTMTKTIQLDNKVVAEFENKNVICPEDSAIFLNKTVGNVTNWQWIFGNGVTSNLKDPLPVHYPLSGRETVYPVKLIASNTALGCKDSMTHAIKILSSCFIAVPSAFTPNGDGVNDYLYPVNAVKADDLDFRVFNRWGQLVFSAKNWMSKWDGNAGGINQEAGAYAWFLSFTHHDTGKKVLMKGITILIR